MATALTKSEVRSQKSEVIFVIPITKSNAILQLYFSSQIVTKIKSLFLTIISSLV
ncbi:MAG: hypothetical protein F6K08_10690 [Okeania sp. SIO1H6]|nr:hypothetical protein [Okeania sp. SIO1H6]